jgi:hypothetical protein
MKYQNNSKRQIRYEKLVLSEPLKKYPVFYWLQFSQELNFCPYTVTVYSPHSTFKIN